MKSGKSRLAAVLQLKCPRCRKGDMFVNKNPYQLKTLSVMHKRCPACNQDFEPEVGFYYGAMWVSYMVGILMSLLIICTLIFLFKVDLLLAFIVVVIFHIGFSPYLFRFSRAVWLSFFVNYHRDL